MSTVLEAGTIRIVQPNGFTAGTGFLVSRQLVVTCAHVVQTVNANIGDFIDLEYYLNNPVTQAKVRTKAIVLENGWSEENDIAILKLIEEPPKWINPLRMQSSKAMEGRMFQGLGFPDDGPIQTRKPLGGVNGLLEAGGYANPLLEIQGNEIDKGLSGSAVVDLENSRAIGMITAYQDIARQAAEPKVRFGYAVPTETIWKVYPDLAKEEDQLLAGIDLLRDNNDNRIAGFMSEYLGTSVSPKPFGGRDEAINTLNNWFDSDIQRFMLAAPAGRGKSALLVHWLDNLAKRDDLSIVFIPISVRFRTNLAATFFAMLGARLAYIHDGPVPNSDNMSTDAWQALANHYLGKPLANNKKLLVVLDGLDEAADFEATPDLIPAELPQNVRVIVSARFLTGDTDVRPWLARLGWERNASTLDLEPLNINGVEDVLIKMGFPLDQLDQHWAFVGELFRLSEGDPLLVNLYVEDLWSRGEKYARLRPEDLREIKPGYTGFFDRWWADQKKLWGEKKPLLEKNTLLIFNLLTAAKGPLSKDDMISIGSIQAELNLDSLTSSLRKRFIKFLHQTLNSLSATELMATSSTRGLNTYIIEEALTALNRFVISIPDGHQNESVGYVLAHPKLNSFFWDRLSNQERADLENLFLQWGALKLSSLARGKSSINAFPRYLLRYYGAHLERSDAPLEQFLPFIDEPYWHQAWFAYEGAYGGYSKDVERAWNTCKKIDLNDKNVPSYLLGKQIRCAFVQASLHSLVGIIKPEWLPHLVKTRKWTLAKALTSIRQISDPRMQSESLIALIPVLQHDDLSAVLPVAEDIQDKESSVRVLSVLAERQPNLWGRALFTARSINDLGRRSVVLSELVEKIPEKWLSNILSAAREIESDNIARARLMLALARKNPDLQQDAFEELKKARSSEPEEVYAEFISQQAGLMSNLWGEALDSVRRLSDYPDGMIRIKCLNILAECMPPDQLDRFLDVDAAPGYMEDLISIQKRLIKRMSIEHLSEFLSEIPGIGREQTRDMVLNELLTGLAREKLLTGAQEIKNEKSRTWILNVLAKQRPEINIEGGVDSDSHSYDSGADRNAPKTPKIIQSSNEWESALDIQRINDEQEYNIFLNEISGTSDVVLYDQKKSWERESDSTREGLLDELVHLRLWDDVLKDEYASVYNSNEDRRNITEEYISKLMSGNDPAAWYKVLSAANQIHFGEERWLHLRTLAKTIPESMLGDVLTAAWRLGDYRYIKSVLVELTKRIPEKLLSDLIAMTRKIGWDGTEVIHHLAYRLETYDVEDKYLLEIVAEISELWTEDRAELLGSLASRICKLEDYHRYSLFSDFLTILSKHSRPDLFSALTALMPLILSLGGDELRSEIESTVKDVTNWWP